jgi:3-deoxy-manno-octulosonate cytidylyltransferase (CMP-KDO synthetase)
MKKCDVIAIIPARWGSTRLPGKPLQMIAGKPMVQRVYERTAQCPEISRTLVATDDQRIIDYVEQFGGQVILSEGDYATGSDRVAGVARQLNLSDETLVLNVQGDQPLVNPKSLSTLLQTYIQEGVTHKEMATLGFMMPAAEATNSGVVKMVLDKDDYALYFSRANIPFGRENPVEQVYTHLGVYLYSHHFLKLSSQFPVGRLEDIEKLEQLRILENGYKIKVVNTDYDSPEVDTPEDVKKIERLIEEGNF